MNRPLVIVLAAVALDAIGIGLIFPTLPALLADVAHAENVAPWVGIMMALYAAMQFVCAPVLGALSDRLGRRPVLLISIGGMTVNYLFLALAPNLWTLLLGRAIAGLTSANTSVAAAYVTDISSEETRPRRFGLLNAMFGMGFIIGPVLGGVLGDVELRLPFVAAAGLSALNLLLAFFLLPESRSGTRKRLDLAALNPLRSLHWLFGARHLLPIAAVFFSFAGAGEVYGTCWALWGTDAFQWNGLWVGLSLGAFGICQTVAQALLPGPAVKRLGERATVLTGIASACTTLIVMAFATRSWMVFAIMPIFALGGIGAPALQSLATRQVPESQQGQLQGVLASAISLASIICPLAFSSFYFVVRAQWPGAIWLSAIVAYAAAIPLVLTMRFDRPKLAALVSTSRPQREDDHH